MSDKELQLDFDKIREVLATESQEASDRERLLHCVKLNFVVFYASVDFAHNHK